MREAPQEDYLHAVHTIALQAILRSPKEEWKTTACLDVEYCTWITNKQKSKSIPQGDCKKFPYEIMCDDVLRAGAELLKTNVPKAWRIKFASGRFATPMDCNCRSDDDKPCNFKNKAGATKFLILIATAWEKQGLPPPEMQVVGINASGNEIPIGKEIWQNQSTQ